MVKPTLDDARAELLRLERMVAHQRSVVAALEAQQMAQPLPPLGMGPLTPELCIDEGCPHFGTDHVCFTTASPERILADIQRFWDWCSREGNLPPVSNPGLLA